MVATVIARIFFALSGKPLVECTKSASTPLSTVAVTTGVPLIIIIFAIDAFPSSTVSGAALLIVIWLDAPRTVAILSSVPVISVAADAATALSVLALIVIKSAALTDAPSTVAVRVLATCETPDDAITEAISDAVPVMLVAVLIFTEPAVAASTIFTSAAATVEFVIRASTADEPLTVNVTPPEANTDFTLSREPSIVVTAVPSTATDVELAIVARLEADTSLSVTSIVRALLPLSLSSVIKVAASFSVIVAVITLVVSASRVLI